MGIRVKNLHNYILELTAPGTITAAASKSVKAAPFAGKISNIVASIGTPGSGVTNTVADVHINGTTIFGDATKVTLASTTGVASYSALATQPTNVAAGDIFTLDLDSVPTSGANVCVLVTITRSNVGAETNVADHDTIM
jgi:hypothetical protein